MASACHSWFFLPKGCF